MGGKEEEKEKSWDIVFMEGYLKKLSKKVTLLFIWSIILLSLW